MAAKRVRAPTFTSPMGTAKYPKLSEIDFGTKEFPKPEGDYSVQLILKASDESTQALISKLEPLREQAIANAEIKFKSLKAEIRKKLGKVSANPLYTELLDPDTEEPTGELSFKFSMRASGQYKKGPKTDAFWDSRPAVFDKAAKPLVQGFNFRDRDENETIADVHPKISPNIWGGSTMKVSFEIGLDKEGEPGYFIPGSGAAGLKLGLRGVQVFEVVSGGQRSAKDFGFGDESEDDDEGDNAETTEAADTGPDF